MTVTVSGHWDYTVGEPERETVTQRGHRELKGSDGVEKVGTYLCGVVDFGEEDGSSREMTKIIILHVLMILF